MQNILEMIRPSGTVKRLTVGPMTVDRGGVNRLRHPLLRAYSNLFGRSVPTGSFILDLESLATSYRERAVELDPDTRLASGESPSDVAVRIASVRNAYRMIRDVMGDGSAWVSAWQTDAARPQFVHVRSVSAPEIERVSAPVAGGPTPVAQAWNVKPVPGFGQTFEAPKARHVATVRSRAGEGVTDPATRDAIYRDLMGPPRPLIGRFLVQEGHITLSQLIAAVTWQRNQRPPVGRIAVDWGILTKKDVIDLLRSKKARTPFCGHAVSEGALQPVQRIAILAHQRQIQRPLGEYFVERGILGRRTVEDMVEKAKTVRV